MNFKKLFVVVIVFAFLLSACATNASEDINDCKDVVTIDVFDLDGKLISDSFVLPFSWEKVISETGNYWQEEYLDFSEYSEYAEKINKQINEYNELVGPLFGKGVLSNYPQMNMISETPFGTVITGKPDECYGNFYENIIYLDLYSSIGGDYPVTANVVGDRVFVTVSSPAGSVVKYSFPVQLLDEAFDKVFREGNFTMPKGQFETVEITSDQSDFTTSLLQNIMSDGDSVESVYFSFTADDFEGRRVMKPMIARAMEIAAGEFDSPVLAVLNGYHTSGYKAVTTVTANDDSISAHGWMFLGMGDAYASGGGFQYSSNSQTTMEDLTKGSIYMTPVQ